MSTSQPPVPEQAPALTDSHEASAVKDLAAITTWRSEEVLSLMQQMYFEAVQRLPRRSPVSSPSEELIFTTACTELSWRLTRPVNPSVEAPRTVGAISGSAVLRLLKDSVGWEGVAAARKRLDER
jgi:hypothetical protein